MGDLYFQLRIINRLINDRSFFIYPIYIFIFINIVIIEIMTVF